MLYVTVSERERAGALMEPQVRLRVSCGEHLAFSSWSSLILFVYTISPLALLLVAPTAAVAPVYLFYI